MFTLLTKKQTRRRKITGERTPALRVFSEQCKEGDNGRIRLGDFRGSLLGHAHLRRSSPFYKAWATFSCQECSVGLRMSPSRTMIDDTICAYCQRWRSSDNMSRERNDPVCRDIANIRSNRRKRRSCSVACLAQTGTSRPRTDNLQTVHRCVSDLPM